MQEVPTIMILMVLQLTCWIGYIAKIHKLDFEILCLHTQTHRQKRVHTQPPPNGWRSGGW